MSSPRQRCRTPVLALALLPLAGCGGNTDDPSPAASSRTPTSATSRTPAPVSRTPVLPAAADGTDLHACNDSKCEVVVSAHDVIHPSSGSGVAKVTVTKVSSKGCTYVGTGPGIVLTLSGQRPGHPSTMNNLTIKTIAISDGKAVIRLSLK